MRRFEHRLVRAENSERRRPMSVFWRLRARFKISGGRVILKPL